MELTLSVLRCPDSVVPEQRRVPGGDYVLGRGADASWVLPDPDRLLSKHHCVLEFRGGGWQVRDLSTNGTFVNHATAPVGRDQVKMLEDGDRLRLGAYEIEVRVEQSAAQPSAWGGGLPAAEPARGGTGWDQPAAAPSPGWDQPAANPAWAQAPAGPPPAWGAPQEQPWGAPAAREEPLQPRLPGDPFVGARPAASGMPGLPSASALPADFDPFADAAPAADHRASTSDAFVPPRPMPQAPPAAGGWDAPPAPAPAGGAAGQIPDDWNFDLSPAAAPAAPASPPRPPAPDPFAAPPGFAPPPPAPAAFAAPPPPPGGFAPPGGPDPFAAPPAAPAGFAPAPAADPFAAPAAPFAAPPAAPAGFAPAPAADPFAAPAAPFAAPPVHVPPPAAAPPFAPPAAAPVAPPQPAVPDPFAAPGPDPFAAVPPAAAPTPPPVTAYAPPPAAPGTDPFAEPPPAPRPAAPPPPPPVAEHAPAPRPAAPAGSGGGDAGLAAFLAGAGLPAHLAANTDPDAALRALGAAFHAAISGLRQLLIARADVKREFRIEQTMLRSAGNNPVKFAASDEQALSSLLTAGPQTGPRAVRETVEDLTAHQVATLAATQAAARALLARLAPEGLEAQEGGGGGGLFASKDKKLWEAYKRLHQQVTEQFDDDFDSAFGKEFARAYEQASRKDR